MTRREDRKIKFTDQWIKSLKGGEEPVTWSDTAYPGLRLNVLPSGLRTFRFTARSKVTGEPINKTIGRYPEVTLKDAHDWARDALGMVANKEDPKVILPRGDEKTVAEALADYGKKHMATRRTGKEKMVALTSLATRARWMTLPINSLTKAQAREAIDEIVERGKLSMAGSMQILLSSFLNWCVDAGYREYNPISGMKLMGTLGEVRDRTLEDDEIRLIWTALTNAVEYGIDPVYARSLLISLTTGLRPGMPSRLLTSSVVTNDAKHGWYLRFTRDEMKMDRKFILPLNRLARDIIGQVDLKHQEFVCPTTSSDFRDKGKHLRHRSVNRQLAALIKRLGMEHWTPRDLRRTVTTLLRRHKNVHGKHYSREDIRPFLAHQEEDEGQGTRRSKRTVMDHYDHWHAYEQKQEIADHLARVLTRIVSEGGMRAAA